MYIYPVEKSKLRLTSEKEKDIIKPALAFYIEHLEEALNIKILI